VSHSAVTIVYQLSPIENKINIYNNFVRIWLSFQSINDLISNDRKWLNFRHFLEALRRKAKEAKKKMNSEVWMATRAEAKAVLDEISDDESSNSREAAPALPHGVDETVELQNGQRSWFLCLLVNCFYLLSYKKASFLKSYVYEKYH